MAEENRWVEAGNALNGLANTIIDYGFDSDGIDLSFLNSDSKFSFSEIHEVTVVHSSINHREERLLIYNRIKARLRLHSPKSLLLVSRGACPVVNEPYKSYTGGTPTGTRVSQILNAHVDKLDAVKGTTAYAAIKPLDVIVITDGAPSASSLTLFVYKPYPRYKLRRSRPF